ncbi:MAG: helix-turn-helix domain-containing protein [Candidatus Competibacteraceae bacterium]|nr:helix-turn-helix domain-containing protein [Candidatus Competibacteraceae bacterium]
MFFANNIQLLRKRKKRSQEELAGALGLKRTTLSAYEQGIAEPNLDTLVRFSRFFKISIDKLLLMDLSTISEMYLSELEKGLDSDITGKKIRILATTVNEQNEDNIEVVPLKAKAGYTSGYADPEYLRVLPCFHMPFLSREKKYRTFQISGDSMPPVSDRAWVTGEYVQNWNHIRNGEPYIIVTTDEGVVFKIVYNKVKENQSLLLTSTNQFYAPYEVNISEVIEVWKFVHYISPELPELSNETDDVSKALAELKNEVALLKNRFKDPDEKKNSGKH